MTTRPIHNTLFLTLDEAADDLRCSKRHVQDLIAEGILAAHGAGKGIRVVAESVHRLCDQALEEAERRRAQAETQRASKPRRKRGAAR